MMTPRTILCPTTADMRAAIGVLGTFFARPSYSRGGVQLFTNAGPLAGALRLEECQPSESNPWLVQELVHGLDVCTFSVCHHGRVVAHSTYVHPREIEHAGGIVFESVDEPDALEYARRIAAETGYHGHLSLDFMKTENGLVAIECNPRPTAGVYLMRSDEYARALLAPADDVLVVKPGKRRKISIALVRDMVLHWREIPKDLPHLLSTAKDVYLDRHDALPGIFQVLSYSHVLAYRRDHVEAHGSRQLLAAYFDDVQWDGESLESHATPATLGGHHAVVRAP